MAKDHDFFDESKPTTFKVDRKDGYQKRTTKGFRGDYWNSHHVIPCTSLKTSLNEYLEGKAPYFKKALGRFTNWDVNKGYNLLGMANEAAYLKAYGDAKFSKLNFVKPTWMLRMRPALKGGPTGPIHLPTSWGHPRYSDKVKQQLDVIWDDVGAKVNEHKKIEGKDLQAAIQDISDVFCAMLQAKLGQTKKRWEDDDQVRDKFFRMA